MYNLIMMEDAKIHPESPLESTDRIIKEIEASEMTRGEKILATLHTSSLHGATLEGDPFRGVFQVIADGISLITHGKIGDLVLGHYEPGRFTLDQGTFTPSRFVKD